MSKTKTFRFARPGGQVSETQAITAISAVRRINRAYRILAKPERVKLAWLKCRQCNLMKSAHGPNLAGQTFIKHEFVS